MLGAGPSILIRTPVPQVLKQLKLFALVIVTLTECYALIGHEEAPLSVFQDGFGMKSEIDALSFHQDQKHAKQAKYLTV